jgi:membrane protease YdiL (CAAX protease family)
LDHWAKAHGGLGPFWSGEAVWWALALTVLLYARVVERQPFSTIGFRAPRFADIGWSVVFAVAMLAGMMVISAVIFPLLHLTQNAKEYHLLIDRPVLERLALVTRAAVCEEILFRGYALSRIEQGTGSVWLAALISCAVFTYAHLASWGGAQLIIAGFGGVLLTIQFVWRRNIWGNMLTHWITDGVGFVLLPMLMARH